MIPHLEYGSTQAIISKTERSGNNNNQKPQLENEKEKENENTQGATIGSGIVNLSNTILGAGMLGLPGALGGTGYGGGLLLILTGALFSAQGLYLLSRAAVHPKVKMPSSFYSVAHAAVPSSTILIDLAVTLKCFGVATGYLITIGNCLVDACHYFLPASASSSTSSSTLITVLLTELLLSRRFWVVGALVAVVPVSFYRTLDELKKASTMALFCILLLAVGIVAYANGWAGLNPCGTTNNSESESQHGSSSCRGDFVAFTTFPKTISKLPIFIFAFTCQQNIFPIVNELHHRTQTRVNTVISATIGLSFVLFTVVALAGYHTFGSQVRGDILLNYPQHNDLPVTLLRLCIAVMLVLHYPLQLDPSRRCLTSLLKVLKRWWSSNNNKRRRSRSSSQHHSLSAPAAATVAGTSTSTEDQEVLLSSSSSSLSLSKTSLSPSDKKNHYSTREDEDENENEDAEADDRVFVGITLSFLCCSFMVAMIIDDLGLVLAFVGATGSTLVSYILPGLIYLNLTPSPSASESESEILPFDWIRGAALLQLLVGCCLMPLALYYVIHE